jgi:hypothetical protein
MTDQRSIDNAIAAVAAATNTVVKQGGVIHENGLWDAHEAALDGASTQVLVEYINGTRTEEYKSKGGWAIAVGNN